MAGEGIDPAFTPDITLQDEQLLRVDDWALRALHTPGHMGNHMCFVWNHAVFTGDHVMGWSSSIISPPDGDLTDFMASCHKLQDIAARVYYPGHGAPIHKPMDRLAWLIAHRQTRSAEVTAALVHGPKTPATLAQTIYADLPTKMLPIAERNVLAHLIDLVRRDIVAARGGISAHAEFGLLDVENTQTRK
uniref:LACTB2 winged helix domain-containing protein n=1 Tax=Yoonia rhodophyticola TaxID=3137370 RepID=A0AAN0M7H5_9RHOB